MTEQIVSRKVSAMTGDSIPARIERRDIAVKYFCRANSTPTDRGVVAEPQNRHPADGPLSPSGNQLVHRIGQANIESVVHGSHRGGDPRHRLRAIRIATDTDDDPTTAIKGVRIERQHQRPRAIDRIHTVFSHKQHRIDAPSKCVTPAEPIRSTQPRRLGLQHSTVSRIPYQRGQALGIAHLMRVHSDHRIALFLR